MLKLTALALTLLLTSSVQAEKAYWNQFRGPNGDGTTSAKNLPVEFSEDSNDLVWNIWSTLDLQCMIIQEYDPVIGFLQTISIADQKILL